MDMTFAKYLCADYAQIIIIFLVMEHCPWWLQVILSCWLGLCYLALFGLGHEAGHGHLAKGKCLNDFLGSLALLPTFWHIDVWRRYHRTHHRFTNLYPLDDAFRPMEKGQYQRSSVFWRQAYWLTRSYFIFLATIALQLKLHVAFFRKAKLKHILPFLSVITALLIVVAVKYGTIGVLMLIVLPNLVFNFLFSMLAFLQHTNPAIVPKNGEEWNMLDEQMGGTVHLEFLPGFNWLTHGTNLHLAHHIYPREPAYRLADKTAKILQENGLAILRIKYSFIYLLKISAQCFVIEKRNGAYIWLHRRDL